MHPNSCHYSPGESKLLVFTTLFLQTSFLLGKMLNSVSFSQPIVISNMNHLSLGISVLTTQRGILTYTPMPQLEVAGKISSTMARLSVASDSKGLTLEPMETSKIMEARHHPSMT
jgi:hypothetical protein